MPHVSSEPTKGKSTATKDSATSPETTLAEINEKIAAVLPQVPQPYADNYRLRAEKFELCRPKADETSNRGDTEMCRDFKKEEEKIFSKVNELTPAETRLEALEIQRRVRIVREDR